MLRRAESWVALAFRGGPAAAVSLGGGIAGMGLPPEEVPVIVRRGAGIVPPEKMRRGRDLRPITVSFGRMAKRS